MLKRIIRILLTLAGLTGGLLLGINIYDYFIQDLSFAGNSWVQPGIVFLTAFVFGLIGFIIAGPLVKAGVWVTKRTEQSLQKLPFSDLLSGTVGLILGLLVALLLSPALGRLPFVGSYLPVIASVMLGYLGASLGFKWREKLVALLEGIVCNRRNERRNRKEAAVLPMPSAEAAGGSSQHPKVLDTSVIIDGRIVDICKTGFMEGPLVIANFVLDELRHIADSGDALKRNRGRRGLDILNELQSLDIEVVISDLDFDDVAEVDAKLVRLAKVLGGFVVTNDYNLNKVASFQKVRVLNINELAGAIKTVVMPGEDMTVDIVGKGKEADQGVGYLEDGTMIVVENGRKHIGETLKTVVTSVIQTNAGRMIFVRIEPS